MGASLRREGERLIIAPAQRLEAGDIPVPGDFSSAAFFIVGALLAPDSKIAVRDVGINRHRIGLIAILSRMGVVMGGARRGRTAGEPLPKPAMSVHDIREPGPEPVVTLEVEHTALHGTTVGSEEVPAAIDELPLVALLGCFAEGETVVSGAEELRHKESDRIATVVEALRALGGEAEALPDGFAVSGTGGLHGGTIDARGDHRIAMLGAVAGVASEEGVTVEGFDAAAVSYPGFERDLRSLTGA
jgi:3-phosphoshikimate 1-carboxyvinyltransferase